MINRPIKVSYPVMRKSRAETEQSSRAKHSRAERCIAKPFAFTADGTGNCIMFPSVGPSCFYSLLILYAPSPRAARQGAVASKLIGKQRKESFKDFQGQLSAEDRHGQEGRTSMYKYQTLQPIVTVFRIFPRLSEDTTVFPVQKRTPPAVTS